MMQGDAYKLSFVIKQGATAVTPDLADDVELVVGNLRKTFSDGEVSFENGRWYFPLTQDETFNLSGVYQKAQVRVKFKGGDIVGKRLKDINVGISLSQEVL